MSAVAQDLGRLRDVGLAAVEHTDAPTVRPLPDALEPVEPLPFDALPQSLRPWVADVAERMQCPPDFVAVPLLVGAASLVARRLAIRPQARTEWTERGNLWALIVGRPGVMKSPAMAQALAPLERMEARAAADFTGAMTAHKAKSEAHKLRGKVAERDALALLKKNARADLSDLLGGAEPDLPVRPRYIVNDLTYEKLGEVLSQNPNGVLSVRDEMRGLLTHLSREEQAPARAFYLTAWSGGRYTFDRIGRGTVTIADARLSMVGCIQPGPLSEYIRQARRGAADDGLMQRFLIAWPDDPGEWRNVDRWPDSAAKREAWSVFDRLDTLDASAVGAQQETGYSGEPDGLPFLRLADDAREAFEEWHAEIESRIRTAEGEGIEGALSKFRTHIPALALLLHLTDRGTGPVSQQATLRALAWAEYFESHARRAFGSGRRLTVAAAKAVLRRARSGALAEVFTARDVYRSGWEHLSDRESAEAALDLLVTHGYLSETELLSGPSGGRPSVVYELTTGGRHG